MIDDNFICSHCGKKVFSDERIGTKNRNHCPYCLWSKHLDLDEAGDRKAVCHGNMECVGLTFKKEGKDKYGKEKQGELMLIHECVKCGKLNINRIAGDDDTVLIFEEFKKMANLSQEKREFFEEQGIGALTENDENEVKRQLLGEN